MQFETTTVGVHQGSALSPFLFLLTLESIVNHLEECPLRTILCADDIVVVADNQEELEEKVQLWPRALADNGLRLNVKKTKFISSEQCAGSILDRQGEAIEKVEEFRFPGSYLLEEGSVDQAEKEAAVISRIWLPTVTTVDETWKEATKAITRAERLELGATEPGRRWIDKQAWLWTDDVSKKVREKKRLYHVFVGDKTVDNWRDYQEAKKAAKKTVAAAKAAHQLIRHREVLGINDENGHLLMDREKAMKRWHVYFEEISNVEFEHPVVPCASPVQGPVQKITVSETEAALRKMKSGKATGRDDLPGDLSPWTLLYVDYVMLACEDKAELERQAQEWCDRLALFGLKLNVKKTEY
ncbi:unnamed protein product [Heligmosomoides polygyrus]|uniref:Reverse transcriptase domain-containing protein n=1 Tax=Heligmosomoides polygyrus TaxID=6339 RepID=A0A3P8C1A5_HELPZ|nr:unnamed protein product [Heligmosomoides polygyrus]